MKSTSIHNKHPFFKTTFVTLIFLSCTLLPMDENNLYAELPDLVEIRYDYKCDSKSLIDSSIPCRPELKPKSTEVTTASKLPPKKASKTTTYTRPCAPHDIEKQLDPTLSHLTRGAIMKQKTLTRDRNRLLKLLYNQQKSWNADRTRFFCRCLMENGHACYYEYQVDPNHHKTMAPGIVEHLASEHLDRENFYCLDCLTNLKRWVCSNNKEEVEAHINSMHKKKGDVHRLCKQQSLPYEPRKKDSNLIVQTQEPLSTIKIKINADEDPQAYLQKAKADYLQTLEGRYCCQHCLNKGFLVPRSKYTSIFTHAQEEHPSQYGLIDLATIH